MRTAFWMMGMLTLCSTLIGCQSTPMVVDNYIDTYQILQRSNSGSGTLNLACEAAVGCDFARVDDVSIIDERTQRPTKIAIERGMIRLEGTVFALHHQYALSLISGEHEVVVRFYPSSNSREEQFHVIHDFIAGHDYKLMMYRQRQRSNGSLLNVAMPGALCVDLLQDNIALRRFCRPYDVMTGLGEFVEQKV